MTIREIFDLVHPSHSHHAHSLEKFSQSSAHWECKCECGTALRITQQAAKGIGLPARPDKPPKLVNAKDVYAEIGGVKIKPFDLSDFHVPAPRPQPANFACTRCGDTFSDKHKKSVFISGGDGEHYCPPCSKHVWAAVQEAYDRAKGEAQVKARWSHIRFLIWWKLSGLSRTPIGHCVKPTPWSRFLVQVLFPLEVREWRKAGLV